MKNKKILNITIILSIVLFLFTGAYSVKANTKSLEGEYVLKQLVVLSRHNIRAPLSTKGSVLDSATPHTWFEWSANASELSLRGGLLETAMGQYFRKWLEMEELITENYRPQNEEVRFYSNAKQRTIATSRYFLSGFLPVSDLEIITKADYDTMDPVFTPQFTFLSDTYIDDAKKQMEALIPDLSKEYQLLTEVIDFKDSDAYKNKEVNELVNGDTELVFENLKEPNMKGSLKTATSLADALVLQYYESPDEKAAAFNHELSLEDWVSLSRIKDVYGDVLFTAPIVSVNVAHPLLEEIDSEMKNKERLFSFLCGHDSNIGSVLAALDVKEYTLPEAIETKTPIGSKLCFEKWEKDNEQFVRVRLVYDSVDKLRNISIHDLNNEPVSYQLEFKGLNQNEDGLYKYDDFINHLENAIKQYDVLLSKYNASPVIIPKTGIE